MNNKKKFLSMIALILVMVMAFGLFAACGNSGESEEAQDEGTAAEETAEPEDTAAEETAEPETGEAEEAPSETPEETPEEAPAETKEAVTYLDRIDEEDMFDLPLQMESITLYSDGSVGIVPTGDPLANAEASGELTDGAIYPFKDSGKASEIYVFWVGNAGYRTVVCLMEDGTVSGLNPSELIENHKAVAVDNLAGRNDFVSVYQFTDESAQGIMGVTEAGDEVLLDESLW